MVNNQGELMLVNSGSYYCGFMVDGQPRLMMFDDGQAHRSPPCVGNLYQG